MAPIAQRGVLALALAAAWAAVSAIQSPWLDYNTQSVLSVDDEAARTPRQRQPNIVLILADDQDLRLDSVDYMPLLKKHMIDEGLSFDNHFTTTSICCPARVALWTGRQPHNTNVTDVDPPYGGFPKFIHQGLNDKYLPVWLQNAGYNTYYTGKLFNSHSVDNYNDPEHAAGWTASDFLLDPGTYSYLNPIYQRDHERPVQHRGAHTSDLLAEKAMGFLREGLRRSRERREPFFLAIAPIAPHSNLDRNVDGAVPRMTEPVPCARHAHLFPEARVPRTPNFNPPASSSFPPAPSGDGSGSTWLARLPLLDDAAVAALDSFYRQRLCALQAVDELVADVVAELFVEDDDDDDNNDNNNTFVLYTSDNGFHLGQHRLPPGKECGIEEDVRVPLYVRGPGLPRGERAAAAGAAASGGMDRPLVTTHLDLAPTILELAGVDGEAAEGLGFDGVSLGLGRVSGQGQLPTPRAEHVGIEFWGVAIAEGENVGGFDGAGQVIMPNNTYKALRVLGGEFNLYYAVWCGNEHELYDLNTDPGQMHNLYPSTTQGPTGREETTMSRLVHRLDALLMVLKSCKGSTCVEPWREIHPRGDVDSLSKAMDPRFDDFYRGQIRVSFEECAPGYIIEAEGPQVGYQFAW